MMTRDSRSWAALALFLGACAVAPPPEPPAPTPSPEPPEPVCRFNESPGREFQFTSADSTLQSNGYVLWKLAPSLLAEPLRYAEYQGRRGKLTGATLQSQGVRWFEGFLEDCSPVYAEDASGFSGHPGIRHLELYGRVMFYDMRAAAESLMGHSLIVRGSGLEPRQRLYTSERGRAYPLRHGEALTVTGIDAHRYSHAKGVGPFFLEVERREGQRGLIKFNPEYLRLRDGPLPMRREPAPPPFPPGTDVVVQAFAMDDEAAAVVAAFELRAAGYQADVVQGAESPWFRVHLSGLAGYDAAAAAVADIRHRFGWEAIILAR